MAPQPEKRIWRAPWFIGAVAVGFVVAWLIPLLRQVSDLPLLALLLICGTASYFLIRRLTRIEQLYSLVAYNSRDLISRITLDGIRTWSSPSVREVLGWEPEEVTGRYAEEVMHPEDRVRHDAMLAQMRQGHKAPPPFVFRARHKNGEFVWLESVVRRVNNTEFVATSRDVTERVVAEMELKAANAELQRLATQDGLTHVANRRSFDHTLNREWRRASREGQPISLLMIDVDYFKNYNDALGHPAGDECLRRVAQTLSRMLYRAGDMVARYGGEEFVMLLPATDSEGATALGRRIAAAIASLGIEHPASPIGYVTCSMGLATLTPGAGSDERELLDAADAALYMAKRSGRNRICSADSVPDESCMTE